MRCPTLNELPSPSPGKTGWPWTEEGLQLPDTLPGGQPWPRVGIVTPSFNQGQFIEETIRSVLLQGYPNLEYAVMDGGSTDRSVDIIRKYEPWLVYWVSEPDRGQGAAVQQGWQASTADVLAYLNSDDTYLPGAVSSAVRSLQQCPGTPAVCGGELRIDRHGHVLRVRPASNTSQWELLNLHFISQPATFLRRTALLSVGGVDTTFEHVFDFELWLRVTTIGAIEAVPVVLAATRWYPETKTQSQRPVIADELIRAVETTLIESGGWSAEQQAQVVGGLHLLAASLYLEQPRFLVKAARSWWRAFARGSAQRRRLLRLPLVKAKWHVQRLLALRHHRYPTASSGVHWSTWVKRQQQEAEVS